MKSRAEKAASAAAKKASRLAERARKTEAAKAARKVIKRVKKVPDLPLRVEEALRARPGDIYLKDFSRKRQLDNYSCGFQCSMAVLDYYGVRIEAESVAARLKLTEDGLTPGPIRDLFRGMGFRVSSARKDIRKQLEGAIRRGAPMIVGVDPGDPHWAVLYGVGPQRVYIADPSFGRAPSAIATWAEFRRRWDGSGIVIEPSRSRKCQARREPGYVEA